MSAGRLSLARGANVLPPLTGTLAVFGPVSPEAVAGLGDLDVTCCTSSKHLSDLCEQAGLSVSRDAVNADHALVLLPRAKAEAFDLIARAVQSAPEGWIVVDGQKTDGVDSVMKTLARKIGAISSYSKAHGKTFWFRAEDAGDLSDWRASPTRLASGFVTDAGVFSADDIDPASAFLVQSMPPALAGQVVDLGAGWGYLAAEICKSNPKVTDIHLVEDNAVALDCARQNVPDQRAQFHWADALGWKPAKPADWVVMNPPFHKGRSADPELGMNFIRAAARMLAPSGRLLMVANAHLPYEATLNECFSRVEVVTRSSKFKIFLAEKGRDKKR